MKMTLTLAAVAAAGLLSLGPAQAAPVSTPRPAADASPASQVEQVQAWRYRRDCRWIGNGWHYRRGGRLVVCRPNRPSGAGWIWHRQGNRYGWWHPGRRSWHHQGWR